MAARPQRWPPGISGTIMHAVLFIILFARESELVEPSMVDQRWRKHTALWCDRSHRMHRFIAPLRGGGGLPSALPRTRKSRFLVVVGGTKDGTEALRSMESLWRYSSRNSSPGRGIVRRWEQEKPHLSCGRDSLAVAACQSRVYAIGGYNGSIELCSVESLDISSSKPKWRIEPRMRKRRSNVGAAVVGHRLYVVGGYNGTHDLPNVEVLQLDQRGARMADTSWQWGPQLMYRRSGAAIASLHGKLYAIGGYDGRRLLETTESLDDGGQAWQGAPPLLCGPRGGAAAASVAGRIYVMGGAGAGGRTAGVESLDPREGRWRQEQPMSTVRSGPAAVGVEETGQIFVLGGFDGQNPLRTVESYDLRMGGKWTTQPDTMSPRWGSGVVSLGLEALYRPP